MSNKKPKKDCPMTLEEREKIVSEVVFKLVSMDIWNLPDVGMQRFRIMLEIYKKYGKEFEGEEPLPSQGRKIIYHLHNNRNKKTVAYISKPIM